MAAGRDDSADAFQFGSRQIRCGRENDELGRVASRIERLVVMGGDRNGMGHSDRRSGTIDKS